MRGWPGIRSVAAVEPEIRHTWRALPNDPALTAVDPLLGREYQWYLHQQGFPAAWDLSRGTGAVVGIIDSGIDSGHPDLGSKIKSAHDHDGTTAGIGDEVGHGTHVSGLACGAPDNGFGIAGAGLDCQVDAREERPHQLERDRIARRRGATSARG